MVVLGLGFWGFGGFSGLEVVLGFGVWGSLVGMLSTVQSEGRLSSITRAYRAYFGMFPLLLAVLNRDYSTPTMIHIKELLVV